MQSVCNLPPDATADRVRAGSKKEPDVTLARAAIILSGLAAAGHAAAQPMLYAQRLPEGTVYVRLASALPDTATIGTPFAGTVTLGNDGAARISPYFVAGSIGGTKVALQVTEGAASAVANFEPKSGTFITVVLHQQGSAITTTIITDKPEYNQLKARLTFYNATEDCAAGSLADGAGRPVFQALAPGSVQARAINPVTATVTAACATGHAAPLSLGQLDAGGLYSVWMMRPAGQLIAFMAKDTIAPPRS